MSTTPRLAQTFCLAILLVAAAFVPAARSEAAKNTESASRIGPPVPLSAEQVLAIQAKRVADPGTLRPRSAPPVEKLAGLPPAATARVSPIAAPGGAAQPGKPHPTTDRALMSFASWRSFAARLGPIPRPEWSTPGMPAKPADITVSRPRSPADATSRAPAPVTPGGER